MHRSLAGMSGARNMSLLSLNGMLVTMFRRLL